MSSYFHFSGGLLENGSVILPGNWGRLIAFHGWNHNCAAREMFLENSRLKVAPSRPSRLESCFAFVTQMEADQGRSWGFQSHVLYEVELVAKDAGSFITDGALCSFNGIPRPDWADAYWQPEEGIAEKYDPQRIREILTVSPLRILRRA